MAVGARQLENAEDICERLSASNVHGSYEDLVTRSGRGCDLYRITTCPAP